MPEEINVQTLMDHHWLECWKCFKSKIVLCKSRIVLYRNSTSPNRGCCWIGLSSKEWLMNVRWRPSRKPSLNRRWKPKVKLPKPTLQKLTETDNAEHFLATFERIATQQKRPKEVWETQVAGLLSGKAMAAYAALTPEDAIQYDKVKEATLRRYEINEETYWQWFRQDRKKSEVSYGTMLTGWEITLLDGMIVKRSELVMIK